ncbi:hypothetical protein [Paracoccus liaowanqingii]|uniref:hypothetical protein n=1 Tax=Paracoccus liaowanqingii TaxID=2560053 RepID=UPI001E2C674E|nr:hypothetical protein [Paracoccus liaowanqingii]
MQPAKPLFLAADGCFDMRLEWVIEVPGHYLLRVDGNSVDAHMNVFRKAPAFQEWCALAGPLLNEPPQVIHSHQVV